MGQGLLPTLGAGCDALETHFGVPVPGVYLAKSWKVASMYRIEPATYPVPEDKNGVSGGSYVSLDGTPPLRAVVRVLANTSRQLWNKGSNQSLYRPDDLFITHICFYAVHRKLAHIAHQKLDMYTFNLDNGTPVPVAEEDTTNIPESPSITNKVAQI